MRWRIRLGNANSLRDKQAFALVPLGGGRSLSPELPRLEADDRERVGRYVERASSPATLRTYRSDWAMFQSWCARRGLPTLPADPAMVAAFLTDVAENGTERSGGKGLSRASIGRRLAAIVFAHRAANLVPPTAQEGAAVLERAIRGIRRDKRAEPSGEKRAADGDILRDMLQAITGDSLRDVRDRALLAIGMGGAFRRSELVAIDLAHVAQHRQGLEIHVPSAKTDQEDAERSWSFLTVRASLRSDCCAPSWSRPELTRGCCSAD
jgi:site-specific recombinase XerC